MITWQRTSSFPATNAAQAIGFAAEVAAYIQSTTGVAAQVSVPIGGMPFRVRWTMQFADLAAMQASNDKLMKDPKYLKLVAKGAANFIAGSALDEIWQSA